MRRGDPARPGRQVRFLPAGDRALMIAPEDPSSVEALAAAVRAHAVEGVSDILPAAETILLTTEPGQDLRALERAILRVIETADYVVAKAPADSELVRIPVSYDGSDLDDVASMLGMSVDEVVREHTGRTWRCAFVGFAPGFGYLVSDLPGLVVPRRRQSRTAVPPGAVALADGYSAVYPRRSPGGWQIIGATTLSTWDLARDEPALIRPGCRVQFFAEPGR